MSRVKASKSKKIQKRVKELTDVQRLPEPIPTKGQQGLWNWEEVNS
ncbi:hypothetical protein [Paenibacillus graminis]|nr:hypothetical protein [Paenibacillus graminis]MEC0173191.1 hypothetical protein [Paenibacillus graminis]